MISFYSKIWFYLLVLIGKNMINTLKKYVYFYKNILYVEFLNLS